MIRILDNLNIRESHPKHYECRKCGHKLGPANENYKNLALVRTVPIAAAQPEYLAEFANGSNTFVMREYYCPQCAVMFEVDMVEKREPCIHSIDINV